MLLLLAAPGFAQTPQDPPANDPPAKPDPTGVARVDVDELPISIARIQRKLAQTPPSSRSGLKLEYYVEVVGKAPPIDVFGTFDVKNGPVPWAGMTHREFLDLVTPQEFRSPPMDFSAFFRWLSEKLEKKAKQ
ncbi:MAG: hypothetical protein HY654_01800 [Acidobacteria bacterium]|nr:hypothetical protein [Acidobacteriota bacterium]